MTQLNLEFNVAKTPEQPISIQQPRVLLDHTQKMHYDQRFETIRNISLADQKEANQIFSDAFLVVENEGDIKKLASSSAALVVRFFERNELDNLQAITLNLLEAGITKPETLRVVMSTQMRIAQEQSVNLRFRDFLLQCQDTDKLEFLKLLPIFMSLAHSEPIIDVLQKWLDSDNYLIRSSIYEVISLLNLSESFPNIRNALHNELNTYVKAKIVGCLGKGFLDFGETAVIELLESKDPSIASAIFWLIEASWQDTTASNSVYTELLVRLAEYNLTSELNAWCQRFLLEKNQREWKHIYNLIASDIRRLLLECSSAQIGMDGGNLILISSIEQVDSKGVKEESDSVVTVPTGLPNVIIKGFGYECQRVLYGHLSDPPEYVCQIVECPDGRRATVEYIHINRLLSVTAFPTVDSWWSYLDRLQAAGVVSILDKGNHSEHVIYCVYDISPDQKTLLDVIVNSEANQDHYDLLRVSNSIVKAMQITEEAGFRFDGVVPHNIILTASNGPCKFLNIGFGLLPPNHNCAQQNCRHYQRKTELGPTTGQYVTGLSVLELSLGMCPFEELQKARSESEPDRGLANILGRLDCPPHMRSVLGRILQETVDWRYPNLSVLNGDLERITAYKTSLQDLKTANVDEKERDEFTVVDYILFRYSIALRNPSFSNNNEATLDKAQFIVEDYL